MTVPLDVVYVGAVLDVGWQADYQDYVFWRPDRPRGWTAYAMCNDWFEWACADCEEILPSDIGMLRQCLEDLKAIEASSSIKAPRPNGEDAVALSYLPQLFASRKRELRPMSACYRDPGGMGPRVAALFDAAGPPRIQARDGLS